MWKWLRQRLSGRQIGVLAFVALVFVSGTIGRLNIEKWAEEKGLDRLLVRLEGPVTEAFAMVVRFLASDFAIGIAIGAFVIAFWANIARLITWLRNRWGNSAPAPNLEPFSPPLVSDPFDARLYSRDPAEEAPERNAYYQLMDFVLEYVVPACSLQIQLQKAIIGAVAGNEKIAEFAMDGLQIDARSETKNFWKFYNTLLEGIDSSEPTIRFDALMGCIKGLESGSYKRFCAQADDIARSAALDLQRNSKLAPAREAWREAHNALVDAYEKVKRDVRYKKLFRPLKESRWGEFVPRPVIAAN